MKKGREVERFSVDLSFRRHDGGEKKNGIVKGNKIEGRFAGLERLRQFSSFRGGGQRSDVLEDVRGKVGKNGVGCG